jgi:hypothetical protein
MIAFVLGSCLAAALVAGGLLSAYLAADRLFEPEPRVSTSQRLAAAAVIFIFAAVALFWVLAPWGGFRRGIVAVATAGLTALAWRHRSPGVAARARGDLRAALATWSALGPWRPVAVGFAAIVALIVARGLASPPLAWDALTYHLVNAGRFAQTGGLRPLRGPDAWGYFWATPPHGEILWAWAMLPIQGDALLAPAGLGVLGLLLLACYTATRVLGGDVRRGALVALAVASSPAIVCLTTTSYVDPLATALLTLATTFLARAAKAARPRPADLLLGVAALATCAGIKHAMLIPFALGLLLAGVRALRVRPVATAWATASLSALACLVGAAHYLRMLQETGNPFYPVSFHALGFAGNEEFALLTQGRLQPDAPMMTPLERIVRLFVDHFPIPGWPHRNLGLGAPLLLALAACGAIRARPRLVVLWIVLCAAAWPFLLAGDDAAAFRSSAWFVSGRYFTAALAGLAVLAGAIDERWPDRFLAAAACLGLASTWPLGLGAIGVRQVAVVLTALAVLSALLLVVLALPGLIARLAPQGARREPGRERSREARRRALRISLAAGVGLAAAAGLGQLRRQQRYPTWQEANGHTTWDFHSLSLALESPWQLWQMLDGPAPLRLAVTGGWDGVGQVRYLYPLFGARLQNDLAYVPVTRTGAIVDHRDRHRLDAELDLPAWHRRLRDGAFDMVVFLPPSRTSPELDYVRAHPDAFVEVPSGARDALAFRVLR